MKGATIPVSGEKPRKKLRTLIDSQPSKNLVQTYNQDFENTALVFVPYDMVFSKKRIDIIKEQVSKRGGHCVYSDQFTWDYKDGSNIYVIVHPKMTWQDLLESVPLYFHQSLNNFLFINCDWIVECLKLKQFIQPFNHIMTYEKDGKSHKVELEAEPQTKISDDRTQHNSSEYSTQNRNVKKNDSELKIEIEASQNNPMIIEEEIHGEKYKSYSDDLTENELKKNQGVSKNATKDLVRNAKYLYDYLFQQPSQTLYTQEQKVPHHFNKEHMDMEFDHTVKDKGQCENSYSRKTSTKETDMMEEHSMTNQTHDIFPVKEEFLNFGGEDSSFEIGNALMSNSDSAPMSLDKSRQSNLLNYYKMTNPSQVKHEDFAIKEETLRTSKNKKSDTFVCQTGASIEHYNELILEELGKLLRFYTNEKDKGRTHAYRKAIAVIKSYDAKIKSAEDLKDVPGIGVKIREKINEIIETGSLRKAKLLETDDKQQTLELFGKIWGVGVNKATELYKQGITTINDLRNDQSSLSHNQKIGLKHFEDFQKRIPRDEVELIVKMVQEKIEEISDIKGIYQSMACGSYRRGKATCGDVDVIITRKDDKPFGGFLAKLTKALEGNLLTDHLTHPKLNMYNCENYMGVGRVKEIGIYRRVDLKIYPKEQYGYAVLYFTGSDFFNRNMRLFARKQGLMLSDHGLYPVGEAMLERGTEGASIPCYNEEEVFEALGLDYRKPEEREL